MNYARSVIFVLLCALASSSASAQYTEDEGGIENERGYLRYLGLGAGATYQVMNDPAVSPIWYSKVGAAPMLTNMKMNQVTFSEVSLRASMLSMTHNTDKLLKVNTKTSRALADYRFMIKVPSEREGSDLRAGAILSGMFMHKTAPHLLDAGRIYEYAASLGLTGRFTRELTIAGKTSFFSWDLAIPVLANIGRPYFLNREEVADPENKIFGDLFANSYTSSFGRFFRLDSRIALFYRLDNGNMVRIAYEWDYTRVKTIDKAYYVEHLLSLTFMFNY